MLKQFEIKNIYIGEYWWKPWANTLAYYPLKVDINDYSGNWYNLSNSTWTPTITTAWWVSCLYCNGSNSLKQDTFTTNFLWQTITLSSFVYFENSNCALFISSIISSGGYPWFSIYCSSSTTSSEINTSSANRFSQSISVGSWWHHFVFTAESGTCKYYIDWQLVATSNWTIWLANTRFRIWCASYGANYWDEYFSEWYYSSLILENKARSSQEISDYYNQTKSNYWL